MLKLILGRSGSGKSAGILRAMKENEGERAQYLLIPEQSSHEAEFRLCAENGNTASRRCEVFSFTSLARRVAALYGGLARPTLDEGGRLLLLYRALKSVDGKLEIFGPPSQKPEFLAQVLSLLDDFKSCCVSVAQLFEIATMADGLAAKKLKDLALIYGSYDALTAQIASDPRDRLTHLYEALRTAPFAEDCDLYIDGFTDFTPQEERVILALMRKAHCTSIALCCDALDDSADPNAIFANARQSAHAFLRMAKEAQVVTQVNLLPSDGNSRPAALRHIEATLFAESPSVFEDAPGDALHIVSAASRRDELSFVAAEIRRLLQSGSVRARDIAISARSMEPYQDLLFGVFSRFQIPLFQSSMDSILQKPVLSLICAALDVLTGGFAYEDIFRYLKCGLSNITHEDCDLLENYVLLWNIRGSQWTSERGFFRSPSVHDRQSSTRDEKLLAKLNEIRCKVISPYMKFKQKSADSSSSKVKALYDFLEDINLAEILEARTAALLARGEPELAAEYQQLWDILCAALEQCADILGDTPIALDEFSRLLRLLLSRYSVGAIPASLDRVIAGDLPRLSNRRMKVLFFLGAEEGMLPQIPNQQGLLGEEEHELFIDYGITLTPPMEAQLKRELNIIYTACTQPTQSLYITWPTKGDGGSVLYPSLLITRLRTLFPDCEITLEKSDILLDDPAHLRMLATTRPALKQRLIAAAQGALVARLDASAAWKRGLLSAHSVRALYGEQIALSPSRLDQYKHCRFAYFAKFGLRAKARREAGFHAPEYGTFVHFVLEFVLRTLQEDGTLKDIDKESLDTLTQRAVALYSSEALGGLEDQSARFRYLFHRLQKSIFAVVCNVVDELRASDFQPIFFELGFGEGKALPPVMLEEGALRLQVSGSVDRVDAWVKDDTLYLKIVDYKTGRKSFDFTDIWNGLGLQMLVYLFALEQHPALFGDYTLKPAGVLYLPARDVLVSGSRNMPLEQQNRLVDKELTRRGLVLDDPAVLDALENSENGALRFLPLRVSSKTGDISGDALVSAEQLGKLDAHIKSILRDICIEMSQGAVAADPYWRSPTQNACLYCDFADACHFDESLGEERRRYIPTVRNSDFWSYLEAQEEGGKPDGI